MSRNTLSTIAWRIAYYLPLVCAGGGGVFMIVSSWCLPSESSLPGAPAHPSEPWPQGAPSRPPQLGRRTAECLVTWRADSDICSRKGPGDCTTLHQGDHVTLEEARAQCEETHGVGKSEVVSCGPCQWDPSPTQAPCQKACDRIADTCEAHCEKKDTQAARATCQRECNIAYADCTQKCWQ